MKKLFFILRGLPFLAIFFCFTQCKKEMNSSNITLYNKPLSVIQSCIQGKWKLQYEKGGIDSNIINWFNNVDYIWQFGPKIKITYNDSVLIDTTLIWTWGQGTYINTDSTFIMNYDGKGGAPYEDIIDGIFDDTLVIHDAYSSDPVFYHFIKY